MIAEVVLRVRDGGATALHRDDPARLVGGDPEQPYAAIEVGQHAVASRGFPHESDECLGAVGAALEERVDRDPELVAFDHLVDVRRLSAHDVRWQIEDGVGGIGERGAFAGADADS